MSREGALWQLMVGGAGTAVVLPVLHCMGFAPVGAFFGGGGFALALGVLLLLLLLTAPCVLPATPCVLAAAAAWLLLCGAG